MSVRMMKAPNLVPSIQPTKQSRRYEMQPWSSACTIGCLSLLRLSILIPSFINNLEPFQESIMENVYNIFRWRSSPIGLSNSEWQTVYLGDSMPVTRQFSAAFAAAIQRRRKAQGMSLARLAQETGVTQTYPGRVEK